MRSYSNSFPEATDSLQGNTYFDAGFAVLCFHPESGLIGAEFFEFTFKRRLGAIEMAATLTPNRNLSAMPAPPITADRSVLRRTFDLWPYLFIAISVTGLTYIALTAAR